MIRRPPRSTPLYSSAASDVYKRQDASPVTYGRYDRASSGAIYGVSREGRFKGSLSPIRNLVIAGGGNAGAGVEAVVISGAAAAEALVPGLLSQAQSPGSATRRQVKAIAAL